MSLTFLENRQSGSVVRRHFGAQTMASAKLTIPAFIVLLSIGCSVGAQETGALKLPEDIAARSSLGDPNAKYQVEESRIGTRLERITVRRKNGPDEVYENTNVNSMWVTEENELGEIQNVRRWTINSW